MKLWNKFCGFVLLLFFISINSIAQSTTLVRLNYTNFLQKNRLKNNGRLPALSTVELHNAASLKAVIPENFSTANYGFFCKKELAIEKATKIPLRFRLGSLQQCNYYEGKKQ